MDCYFQVSSHTIFYNKSIIDFQFACHLKVLGDVMLFFFVEHRGWSVVGWEEKGRYFTWLWCCVISGDDHGCRGAGFWIKTSDLGSDRSPHKFNHRNVTKAIKTTLQILVKFSMVFLIPIRHYSF